MPGTPSIWKIRPLSISISPISSMPSMRAPGATATRAPCRTRYWDGECRVGQARAPFRARRNPPSAGGLRADLAEAISALTHPTGYEAEQMLELHAVGGAAAKVGLAHAIVVAQARARAARDDRSGLQHIPPACGLERVTRILLDQEHARATGIDRPHGTEDVLHEHGSEAK